MKGNEDNKRCVMSQVSLRVSGAQPLKETLEDSENTSHLSQLMVKEVVIFICQVLVSHGLRILRGINSPDFWLILTTS